MVQAQRAELRCHCLQLRKNMPSMDLGTPSRGFVFSITASGMGLFADEGCGAILQKGQQRVFQEMASLPRLGSKVSGQPSPSVQGPGSRKVGFSWAGSRVYSLPAQDFCTHNPISGNLLQPRSDCLYIVNVYPYSSSFPTDSGFPGLLGASPRSDPYSF
ncbi:hypothetical protein N658DRAFT_104805 [Parathielavia hyrcaniae]|uniref:Uncharacterized protein n=1 Tax=Parathielavia hyrcaniae TaxID=113614 RepID=A0AAN6T0G9_9PEZI|nr:hypothetical protein N658DRAFT_104805 [Parathielavia hyrcaniae]